MKYQFRMQKCLVLAVALMITSVNYAQTDSLGESKSGLDLSVNYISNLNYYGRLDSTKSSGVSPMAEFWFNQNFYANLSPYFEITDYSFLQYAGVNGGVGYQYSGDKFFFSAGFVKSFFTDNTIVPQSIVKSQVNTLATYFNDILNISGGADLKFSDKTDLIFNVGLDHSIYSFGKKKGIWIIDPSITMNIGSNYFSRYYFELDPSEKVLKELKKIKPISTELSVPLFYLKDKWTLLFFPTYVIPMNLVDIFDTNRYKELGKSSFYMTAGIKYRFSHKK